MLVNFNEMLSRVYRKKRAVGSFNVYNYETMRGVLDAAVEMGAKPVILAFGAKYLENMSLQDAYSMALSLSRQRDIPVCLHLDHCSDEKNTAGTRCDRILIIHKFYLRWRVKTCMARSRDI